MEGKCTLYTKIIIREVYSFINLQFIAYLGHLIYHFHEADEQALEVSFGQLNMFDCDHQLEDMIMEIMSQNVEIAINQFIGER